MLRPRNSHTVALMAAATLLVLATALVSYCSREGIEHALAGVPHWTTACPKDATAILVVGQSQASNSGPRRHISLSGSRAFANGRCYYLRDPMPGTTGRGGSVWPEFANKLGTKVVIADIAIFGSAIEQWTVPRQMAQVRQALSELRDAGYDRPLIIWMQGETDGAQRATANAYYDQLRKLIRSAPDQRWLITRESVCYDVRKKWVPLDAARNQIVRDFKNVTIGPDLDILGMSLRQSDRCHLTAEGQTILAGDLSKVVRSLLSRR